MKEYIEDPFKINLADPELFGNDAAEDEDPEVLASYYVEKPSFNNFANEKTRFAIVRGRKGMGKSALLSRVSYHIEQTDGSAIVISVKGSDLTGLGEFTSSDPAFLVNQWQQVICARINIEIGKRLHLAMTDITMTMVESSELAGLRGKNIVGALLERLKFKLPSVAGLPGVEVQKLQQVNPLFLLQNYSGSKEVNVWLFIDDIDSTFINTPSLKLKIATFFSACRKLVNDVKGISIRASVRTDVWTDIRRIDEALDKCEQYVTDITWSHEEAKRILIKKIFSYVSRTFPDSQVAQTWNLEAQPNQIMYLVFQGRLRWGRGKYAPDRIIHILSAGRPRWSGQLCRLAGHEAIRQHHEYIGISEIRSALPAFGRFRLDDLYREHSHQMVDLQTLIECFANSQVRYTTEQLKRQIAEKYSIKGVKNPEVPKVYGYPVKDELELCRFLYRIGFISARDGDVGSGLAFVRYEDRPDLLSNPVNLDDGLQWEIHPSYRSALNLSN